MTAHKFPLSRKYRDFIRSVQGVTAEFLEGTTASGKTTVGAGVKFMYMVSASPKRLHIIAAKTTGTPYTELNLCTISRHCSIIGIWSSPTGTVVALNAVISAAWLIG